MKVKSAALVAIAFLLLPMKSAAQSTIPWSAIGMGFVVSSSPTTVMKSVLGQVFVGTMTGTSSIIEAGFLADTLLRGTVVSVAEHEAVPKEYALWWNYPNPFNPSTTIKYELPKASVVRLSVYDMLGREVSVLLNERREAGVYEVKFDGSNLASGVYFYRLQAGDFTQTKRLLLLK